MKKEKVSEKFANVPLDEGTKILNRVEIVIDGLDAQLERNLWDSIYSTSLILVTSELNALHDSKEKIEEMVQPLVRTDSEIMIKESKSGYTFITFDCENG